MLDRHADDILALFGHVDQVMPRLSGRKINRIHDALL